MMQGTHNVKLKARYSTNKYVSRLFFVIPMESLYKLTFF